MYFPHPVFFSPHQIKPCHRESEKERLIDGLEGCCSVILWSHCWVLSHECGMCISAHVRADTCYTPDWWKTLYDCVLRNHTCALWSERPWLIWVHHLLWCCAVDGVFHHLWCGDMALALVLWCLHMLPPTEKKKEKKYKMGLRVYPISCF